MTRKDREDAERMGLSTEHGNDLPDMQHEHGRRAL